MERHTRNLVTLLEEHFDEDQKIRGLEVGVFKGLNASGLLSKCGNLFLTLVDPWMALPPNHKFSNSRFAKLSQDDLEAIYQEAQTRCAFAGERAIFFRGTDEQFVANDDSTRERFDFVFIDGSHDKESVESNLKTCYSLVRSGGLFSGHDYNSPKYHGVREAVDEFSSEKGKAVNTLPGRIWWWRK